MTSAVDPEPDLARDLNARYGAKKVTPIEHSADCAATPVIGAKKYEAGYGASCSKS